jgi:phosphonate transport system substrate-binding protein
MNKQIKFGIGLTATILGGLAISFNRPASKPIATIIGISPAIAQDVKPLRIVFPPRSGTTDLENKAKAFADFLSKELQQPVEAIVADETAAVEALRANRADVAFLSSRPALKAQELAILSQLKGKKIAFTSPTSGSGFIFPVAELVKQELVPNRDRLDGFFGQVSYGGGYDKALQAVLRGQADVAAVSEYTLGAPYITAAEASNLRVLYGISGVPAHGVSIDDDVPMGTRNKLIAAMLKFNQPQNNQLLKSLYNSTKLVEVGHDRHLKPIKEALQLAGMK